MKPWGYEEIWAHTDEYVGKILFIAPGQSLSKQYHEKKEETLRILSGKPTILIWDDMYTDIRVHIM